MPQTLIKSIARLPARASRPVVGFGQRVLSRGIHTERVIEASPAHVWDVITDIDRIPTWYPQILAMERLDSGPLGVGSRMRETRDISSLHVIEADVTVTDLSPRAQFGVTGRLGMVTVECRYDLAGRTRKGRKNRATHVRLSCTMRGPLVLYGWQVALARVLELQERHHLPALEGEVLRRLDSA